MASDGRPTASGSTLVAWEPFAAPPLPTPLTSLVGREQDIAGVLAMLAAGQRLVTITGPGGVGKSRLALAVAAAAADFPDGVWFVPLASVKEAGQVLPTLGSVLGLSESGRSLADRLRDHLMDRRLLLVLDNFEQVADAATPIADLVAAIPTLAVLVTSRVPLRVSGERRFDLRPMSVPDPNSRLSVEELLAGSAVTLFLERATAVRPEMLRSREELVAVADLCRRLDGLPLAIELAAARSKALSPQLLAARLKQRLSMLDGGPRDAPDRQRTMRAAIAWSHDLLAPADQIVFRRLAVFVGGFTLDAAEAVVGSDNSPTLDRLSTLLDHNLIAQETGPTGEDRFFLLETIREFGLEQLAADDDADAVRERHARWLVGLAASLWQDRQTAKQAAALDVLQAEQANLRAATAWIAENGRLDILSPDALNAVTWFWRIRGPLVEGRRWIDHLLTVVDPDSAERARILNHAGYMARRQLKFAEAAMLFQESLGIFERLSDKAGRARVLHNLGVSASESGDFPAAIPYFEASQALFRELGDQPAIALSVYNLGGVALHQGDHARATELLTTALAAQRELGDTDRIAMALSDLAIIAQRERDFERALRLFEETLALWRRIGAWHSVGLATFWVGQIVRAQGDLKRCVELMTESIGLVLGEDDTWQTAKCLSEIAIVAGSLGNHLQAARLLGAAERLRDGRTGPFHANERADYEGAAARAEAALGATAYAAARYAGGRLPLADLLAAASELVKQTPAADGVEPVVAKEFASLSPRELEVLHLIVAGLSDREIGNALGISPRTVMKHVSHILDKLDVENRAAAQAYARRLGVGV